MNSELLILNKYMKKLFPFILEVDSVYVGEEIYEPWSSTFNSPIIYNSTSGTSRRDKNILKINIYVSPLHFCELMDGRVENKIIIHIVDNCSSLLKSVITSWDGNKLQVLFFPSVGEKSTILEGLNISEKIESLN
jgi:hypothetical protein